MRAPQFLPHRHWLSGRDETLGNSIYPANQLHAGRAFRRLIRSLSLRPYSLLASRADRTGTAQWPSCPQRLLRPSFQIAGSPRASAGYDYGAKLRIAPAGLSPASTAASLAAPPPALLQASFGGNRPDPRNRLIRDRSRPCRGSPGRFSGLLPVPYNSVTASTPRYAILRGYCMAVAPTAPAARLHTPTVD